MAKSTPCYCGSNRIFSNCCEPVIHGTLDASSAEKLMRSRYSAYAICDYSYILRTYAKSYREQLTHKDLEQSAQHTRWLRLDVVSSLQGDSQATVEFKAYYSIKHQFYLMHELSEFVLEDNRWRYTHGTVMPETTQIKLGRNDLCLCGSNRKFKKCCAK